MYIQIYRIPKQNTVFDTKSREESTDGKMKNMKIDIRKFQKLKKCKTFNKTERETTIRKNS